MKQLNGTDNLFLAMEKGNQTAHVAGLAIYDPATAPGGAVRFKDILKFYEARLNVSKIFKRRLVRVPMDVDRPHWVDDAGIDIEYHIRHIALPYPGDWRQLCIQIARIHARPLDLSRPAWEAYVIEGLDNIAGVPPGAFAMYTKFHHAAIDGEAGAALIGALHSPAPTLKAASGDEASVTVVDRDPTAVELLSRAVGNNFNRMVLASKLVRELAPVALGLGKKQLEAWRSGVEPEQAELNPRKAPKTRFNEALSPHRVVEMLKLPLDEIQAIRKLCPGSTVNDVFMAVCGGALHRYLKGKGELPEETLNAQMPVSTRGEVKNADAGVQIGTAVLPLFTGLDDDGQRLRKIHAAAGVAKQQMELLGKDLAGRLFDVLPGAAAQLALKNLIIPKLNLTVSNVRGPSVPLYMAGAQLLAFMPINMLLNGMGLSVTGFSYNGVLWVCLVADRKMLPDPEAFRQAIESSFQGLLAAATAEAAACARPAPKPARKSAAAAPAVRAPKRAPKRAAKPAAVETPAAFPGKTRRPSPASPRSKRAAAV
ncbi:WS/DGAT/MGAT family acyltransferase [Paucibacter oligotrophus]|uniref:diacylglycerol O-acyltransferase n=1 Tax=Roseateles oligotrophus TaxID=1769250 RepID=A0A840L666_9BURK|nr:wax ester/triacylglycerol synthase family O-acyltransferase [Roseateles oligotrophus]MBB4843680.1 WS/DGAT/MGAT family acyltransferase [Roseateles oligotrophus]